MGTIGRMPRRRAITARWFAAGNALLAIVVLIALFRDLAARSWFAIAPSFALAALLLASSFGLLLRARWSLLALRAAAWAGLALALCALGTLAVSTFQLSRLQAGIAESSKLAPLLLLALLLPYLILYPSAQLLWVHRQRRFRKQT